MKETQPIKAITTKHALTSGPAVEVGTEEPGYSGYPLFCVRFGTSVTRYYRPNEWHLTKDSANEDIIRRYQRKKASLLKQLAKLDKQRDAALEAIKILCFG